LAGFSGPAEGPPGSPDKWVQLTNVDAGPYERRFGAPIMMSACTLKDEVSVPMQRSIRTFGRFDPGRPASWRHPEAAPGSTATARPLCDTPGQTGPVLGFDTGAPCVRVVFQICCEDKAEICLEVTPVPELTNTIEGAAESYRNQRVMVVGAVDGAAGFQFWDFQVMADFSGRRPDGKESGLRRLVAAAEAGDGRVVRVRGQFRGRNLFGDLPAESQRGRDHWVLADRGAALWVMGKAPRGGVGPSTSTSLRRPRDGSRSRAEWKPGTESST
jgi:hypothetical protein